MATTKLLLAVLLMASTPALAQWQGYPTPGIPRTPDGKPNLSAPAPRTFGHMGLEMIIDDPKAYTRPWTIYVELVLQADTELLEFICEENERDAQRMVGK